MLEEKNSQRIIFWDNLKGILIFLVVFGHALLPYIGFQPIAYFLFCAIYLFHMPAFVFIAGYFSSSVSDKRRSIIRIFFAYLVFNYLMMLYAGYIQGYPFKFLEPYYSYWFLLALIVWRLLGSTIMAKWWALPFSILLALVIGFWNDINNTLALSRIIGFAPFYIAGCQVSAIDIKKFLNKKEAYFNILLGFLACVFLVFMSMLLIINGVTFNDLVWHPYESGIGVLNRAIIFFTAMIMITFLLKLIPNKEIPWITDWGKNSLAVLVLHRYVLFFFTALLSLFLDFNNFMYLILFVVSLITSQLTGNNKVGFLFNTFLDRLYKSFFGTQYEKNKKISFAVITFIVFILALPVISHTDIGLTTQQQRNITPSKDIIHPVLTNTQITEIENSVSIAFVGDLILLQDQVREAWSQEQQEYNFDPAFEYAKKYLQEADYAIGVLEGPLAGKEAVYSTSNYGDGIPLYLNFPDTFAKSIFTSGIDLVTVANNHLLDKDVAGAMRTLDVLEKIGLDYVGAFRNQQEKDQVKIIEIEGLRLAVLAYTIPSNYYNERYFFEENTTLTSILVDKKSPYFKKSFQQVELDFQKAKKENPDFIIVLPHMGTQFIHEADAFQELWNEIFIENGADIILTAQSHAVQPIEFRTIQRDNQSKTAIIVNCPGNFVNSYVDFNGDATSIVTVYLDPINKSVVCAGVIPMWTHAPVHGIHRVLPIYEILYNPLVVNQISRFEMERVDEVHKLITSVMLQTELPLDQAQQIYYFFPDGYSRQRAANLKLSNEDKRTSEIYQILSGGKHVCFVGDSVTDGSKNGGYGWFEPLAESVEEITYHKKAWPGATTFTLLENTDKIYSPQTDVYIIAIGINDIRYRDKNICAMTAEDYIKNIDKLVSHILSKRTDVEFVFISPWPVLPHDPFCTLEPEEKDYLIDTYTGKLEEYCSGKRYLYINPSDNIKIVLNTEITSNYLIDHIHPNATAGIKLYSESVVGTN